MRNIIMAVVVVMCVATAASAMDATTTMRVMETSPLTLQGQDNRLFVVGEQKRKDLSKGDLVLVNIKFHFVINALFEIERIDILDKAADESWESTHPSWEMTTMMLVVDVDTTIDLISNCGQLFSLTNGMSDPPKKDDLLLMGAEFIFNTDKKLYYLQDLWIVGAACSNSVKKGKVNI